jgi:hypothetical protein
MASGKRPNHVGQRQSNPHATGGLKDQTKAQEVAMTSSGVPELVEHMAQAIRDTHANRSGRRRPWSDLPRALLESYRQEARAALLAVRDFSDSVLTFSINGDPS